MLKLKKNQNSLITKILSFFNNKNTGCKVNSLKNIEKEI